MPVVGGKLPPFIEAWPFQRLVKKNNYWQAHRHFLRVQGKDVKGEKDRDLTCTQCPSVFANTNVIAQRCEIEQTAQRVVNERAGKYQRGHLSVIAHRERNQKR